MSTNNDSHSSTDPMVALLSAIQLQGQALTQILNNQQQYMPSVTTQLDPLPAPLPYMNYTGDTWMHIKPNDVEFHPDEGIQQLIPSMVPNNEYDFYNGKPLKDNQWDIYRNYLQNVYMSYRAPVLQQSQPLQDDPLTASIIAFANFVHPQIANIAKSVGAICQCLEDRDQGLAWAEDGSNLLTTPKDLAECIKMEQALKKTLNNNNNYNNSYNNNNNHNNYSNNQNNYQQGYKTQGNNSNNNQGNYSFKPQRNNNNSNYHSNNDTCPQHNSQQSNQQNGNACGGSHRCSQSHQPAE
ncbi:MAG: hypothetical protein BYD32DRAFT_464345 [Podila humilis]|nr:MAG: hypothetical protein BYD32DRAFT_464345 [Podila humilis]